MYSASIQCGYITSIDTDGPVILPCPHVLLFSVFDQLMSPSAHTLAFEALAGSPNETEIYPGVRIAGL
jgi:hypothetical protein